MANNEYINKVLYGNDILIDITDTTAETGDVLEGLVFYAKSGARSVGTLGDATTSTHGLMSAADKTKLDGIATNANNYTLPVASSNTLGGIYVDDTYSAGLTMWHHPTNNRDYLVLNSANSSIIKAGSAANKVISVGHLHEATFYGLAKAAGVDMASSENAVGTYTLLAKTAIKTMIGVSDGLPVVRLT